MAITKIIARTSFFIFVGISVITFLCLIELYNGTGLTHPIWDKTYNWIVLFRDITFISIVGAILSSVAGIQRHQHNQPKENTNKGRIPIWSLNQPDLKKNY